MIKRDVERNDECYCLKTEMSKIQSFKSKIDIESSVNVLIKEHIFILKENNIIDTVASSGTPRN